MGLVVAGMAEDVKGRTSGSLHGSQVNVYLFLCKQFGFFFSVKSSSSAFYFVVNYDAVIIV